MKKILLSVIMLAAVCSVSQAQNVFIGPKVGMNVSGLSGSYSSKSKVGVVAGAFVEFRLSEVFGLQPEILFSMQGNKFTVMGNNYATRLNYVNIPVLAKIYFIDRMCIEAGPQIGLLASSKIKGEGRKVNLSNINNADFSVAVGLAYNFDIGLSLSARYNIGVTKTNSAVNQKNGVFQLSAGWRFGL